jgi:trehalose 6-phosphate synthase/phosphatase
MSANARLVIASNRLPFSVRRAGEDVTLQPTSGGLAAALTSVHRRADNVWVGWPGDCSELTGSHRVQLASQLRTHRVVPVELTPPELVEYYDGVCNGVLWPVLHYLIDRMPVTLPDFAAYRTVNERFAEAVVSTYRDGDTVWIHDYHLQLTPALVRTHLPLARIGFFFHTPFPPGDIFRVLPWHRELVEGVLGATLVGFQTSRDASNFAATARMLAECVVGEERIVTKGRQVRFGTYPIGIDPARLEPIGQTDDPQSSAVTCRPHPGRRLLLGVDRLDYTKGILQRLAAFERLLSEEPQLHEHIEMLQLAVPSRDLVQAYVDYKYAVQECVDRINLRFQTPQWTPIHYLFGAVSPAELRALYCAADVMLVTSLRDGMNLVSKEFVSCRTDDDGVLVLSEFAGAAAELPEALIVNPYSVEHLARAMRTALTLDRNARRRRMRSLRERVAARTVHHWVAEFTADLAGTSAESVTPINRLLTTTTRAAIAEGQRPALAFGGRRHIG